MTKLSQQQKDANQIVQVLTRVGNVTIAFLQSARLYAEIALKFQEK